MSAGVILRCGECGTPLNVIYRRRERAEFLLYCPKCKQIVTSIRVTVNVRES